MVPEDDDLEDVEDGMAAGGGVVGLYGTSSSMSSSAIMSEDEDDEDYDLKTELINKGKEVVSSIWSRLNQEQDGYASSGPHHHHAASDSASSFGNYEPVEISPYMSVSNFDHRTWNTADLPVVWSIDEEGWRKWLDLRNKRDWYALTLASCFYGILVVDYHHPNSLEVFGAFLMTFWLAMCVGWLWRHMHACVLSAMVTAFMMFIASSILSKNNSMCAEACG